MIHYYATIFAIALGSIQVGATSRYPLKYCTGAQKIEFSPFEDFASNDVFRLAYLLLLTRPLISQNTEDKPILKRWYYSEKKQIFAGELAENLFWTDGSAVKSYEAAYSIVNAIESRQHAFGLSVIGGLAQNKEIVRNNKHPGIKIESDKLFEIRFTSTQKITAATINSHFGPGNRFNRLWLYKRSSVAGNDVAIVSKQKLRSRKGKFFIVMDDQEIVLATKHDCLGADFFIGKFLSERSQAEFEINYSTEPQVRLMIINPKIPLEIRQSIAFHMRSALAKVSFPGFKLSEGLFISKKENFFKEFNVSSHGIKIFGPVPKLLKVGIWRDYAENHPLKIGITKYFEKLGVKILWKKSQFGFPSKDDLLIYGASSTGQKQKWIEAIDANKFAIGYPLTGITLKEIQSRGLISLPLDSRVFKRLQDSIEKEFSIIPLWREYIPYYSHNSSSFFVNGDRNNELTLDRKTK